MLCIFHHQNLILNGHNRCKKMRIRRENMVVGIILIAIGMFIGGWIGIALIVVGIIVAATAFLKRNK